MRDALSRPAGLALVAPPQDPWINGATDAPGKAAALHPFATYHQAVAQRIRALLHE